MSAQLKILRPPEPPVIIGADLEDMQNAVSNYHAEMTRWLGAITQNEYMQEGAWHIIGAPGEPAYENSWVNFDAGYKGASFKKIPGNLVLLRGLVKTLVNPSVVIFSSVVFTLPEGFRATGNELISTVSADNTSDARIFTGPSGVVQVNIGHTSWTSLFGVIFEAA